MAAYAIADSKDDRQAVVLDLSRHLAPTFQSNYSILSNSCLPVELPIFINLPQMMVYGVHSDLEQICHQRLRQPYGLVFKPALDTSASVFGLVQNHG